MKIEKIKFNNHKIFDNLEIDFKNKEGNVLDKLNYDYISENKIELKSTLYTTIVDISELPMLPDSYFQKKNLHFNEPKIVYMPTEINFEKINKVDNTSSGYAGIYDKTIDAIQIK